MPACVNTNFQPLISGCIASLQKSHATICDNGALGCCHLDIYIYQKRSCCAQRGFTERGIPRQWRGKIQFGRPRAFILLMLFAIRYISLARSLWYKSHAMRPADGWQRAVCHQMSSLDGNWCITRPAHQRQNLLKAGPLSPCAAFSHAQLATEQRGPTLLKDMLKYKAKMLGI